MIEFFDMKEEINNCNDIYIYKTIYNNTINNLSDFLNCRKKYRK